MKRKCITEGVKRRVAASRDWKCGCCDGTLSAAFHIDHRVPLWDGGADCESNMQALCGSCHAEKTMNEGIERARRRREEQERKAAAAQAEFEAKARADTRTSATGSRKLHQ